MTLAPIDAEFAARLAKPKDAVVTDAVAQYGARAIPFEQAPDWPALDGPDDDALIETFLVDATGQLTPLSESNALEAWRPRAEAMARAVIEGCGSHGVPIEFPAYLTGSITPVTMLEGNPHLDDDQLVPGAGLGLVAINGQFVGPRVAEGSLALDRAATAGPLPIAESEFEDFRAAEVPVARDDEIAVLAQFGQLHAGPSASSPQMQASGATHRQLLVLRATTTVTAPAVNDP